MAALDLSTPLSRAEVSLIEAVEFSRPIGLCRVVARPNDRA